MILKNSKAIPDLTNGTMVQCLKGYPNMSDGNVSFGMQVLTEDGHRHWFQALQQPFETFGMRDANGHTCTPKELFIGRKRCEQVAWGWVVTGHKAQGSQWPFVVVHDESSVFRNDAHLWLYTALTRATDELIIVRQA